MITPFISHLNKLSNKMNYKLVKDLRKVSVYFDGADNSSFTIQLNADTQMLSLRKDNYLVDEVKVYDDTLSDEQSLHVALETFISIISQSSVSVQSNQTITDVILQNRAERESKRIESSKRTSDFRKKLNQY